jgi:hypothetical protein
MLLEVAKGSFTTKLANVHHPLVSTETCTLSSLFVEPLFETKGEIENVLHT